MCVWIAQNEINEIKTLISEAPVVRETDPIFARKKCRMDHFSIWFVDIRFPIFRIFDFETHAKWDVRLLSGFPHCTTQHNESNHQNNGGTLDKGSRKGRETAQRSWNSSIFGHFVRSKTDFTRFTIGISILFQIINLEQSRKSIDHDDTHQHPFFQKWRTRKTHEKHTQTP